MSAVAAIGATAAVAALGLQAADGLSAPRAARPRCPVSSPTGRPVPGRPSFTVGNRRVAVDLPPRATFVAVPDGRPGGAFLQRDGWIRAKVGWWTSHGAPHVTGRRLDRRARPLRAEVGPLSWTTSGAFYPGLLFFPSAGCWRLTATAGGGRLGAVVRVVTP